MDHAILERYRDRWVGIDTEGRVIADAEQLDEPLDELDNMGANGITVQRIPGENEPLFVGLR
jgi:hypothetical protein